MKMRYPSVPLITVDPYFSVWSWDQINDRVPEHWTGIPNAMLGTVTVDGTPWCFLGKAQLPKLKQEDLTVDAMTTTVVFSNDQIRLTALFTSPMLVKELYYVSRPVSYLKLSWESLDGQDHKVSAKISCSEQLVLNELGEGRACSSDVDIPGISAVRMGSGSQKVLWRSGDRITIDWGYLYLAVKGEAETGNEVFDDLYAIYAETELAPDALFAFAYDDIDSMVYFEKRLKAYWKKDGKTIEKAIAEAMDEYDALKEKCDAFTAELRQQSTAAGGEKYADLLQLAYRQILAAHKLVVDEHGNNLYISKECSSNGCAATVDVTYPSSPMFLLYNPELLKGMLRPIFRYSRTPEWVFDFAPHDAGQYPLVNGQVYGQNALKYQMPVEECGNMIILMAALCHIENSTAFAEENLDLLETWSNYLIKYGEDPGDQLCTDDFAGHLAHNINLSIKAIMGIAGYSRILSRLGRNEEAEKLMVTAKAYADSLCARGQNEDGSYRLAFDQPETFSLKYNSVWDKLWGTKLFPNSFYENELKRYHKEALFYGVPLDSRMPYTKSDWLHWAACLGNDDDFAFITDLMWRAYHTMRTRAPMCDWYFTDTSEMRGFRHRTVQGGLFLKLLF